MVFWIQDPRFDIMKKKTLMAVIVVMMASAWFPISKEIFLGFMNTEIVAGITVGLIVSGLGLIGAWYLYKRRF